MEIRDELEIQLFHTLEQVKRMNEAIRRHNQTDEPNAFMVEQFLGVRQRLNTGSCRKLLLITGHRMNWRVVA